MRKAKEEAERGGDGEPAGRPPPPPFVVDGSRLPSAAAPAGAPHKSAVSGQPVDGVRVSLGPDGVCCSLAEALDWSCFSPFSPVGDGSPFPPVWL